MPTNLYGPFDNFSENDSHVIPGLIAKMHKAKEQKAEEFKIWGTGKPLREFLYVDDLSRAIEYLIFNKPKESLLNIGSGDEITIYDLAIKIKEVVEFEGQLSFDSTKPDGNPRKLLDSRTINELGWSSEVDLDSGLILTYKWYLNNL